MKKYFTLISCCFISFYSFSQIAIGNRTFDPHAQLDVTATQKGILIPRVTLKDIKLPYPFDTSIDPLPESLLVYNIGGETDVVSGYYYWNNNQWNKLAIKDDISLTVPDAKDITSKELSITPDGKGAVLKDIELSIKDKAVTLVKINPGKSNQILTTNATGNAVIWTDPNNIAGKNMSSDHLEVTGGNGAVLKDIKLTIKDNVIVDDMLKGQTITGSKIKPGAANTFLTTNNSNQVVWADPGTIKVDGKEIKSTDLIITNGKKAVLDEVTMAINKDVITEDMLKQKAVATTKIKPGAANQILTTNASGDAVIWANSGTVDGKNMTSDHLEVTGGSGAVLKDTKLTIKDNVIIDDMLKGQTITGSKIKPGGANTFLTTNSSSQVVWADPGTIKVDGKEIKSTDLIITNGKKAVLDEVTVAINKDVITEDMLKQKAVATTKIKPGLPDQILTTKKDNTVAWETPSAVSIKGGDLTSEHLTITNDGKEAVLKDTKLTIKDNVIKTNMLEDKVIIPVKIKPGAANQILTTNASGNAVVWANSGTVDGKNITSTHLEIVGGDGAVLKDTKLTIKDNVIIDDMLKAQTITAAKIKPGATNTVLTTNSSNEIVWADPTKIEGKNMISDHLEIAGGDGAVLKDIKLTIKDNVIVDDMLKPQIITGSKIKPGGANTVLTTNSSSQVVWADPGSASITNKLVSEGEGENTLKSTVNDAEGKTRIVKEVVNTLTAATKEGSPLKISVNGVKSNTVNIPEPWNVAGGNIKATLNTQDIYQEGRVAIGKKDITDNKQFSLEVGKDALINGITVGKGNGNMDSNTAIGLESLSNNTHNQGIENVAIGKYSLRNNTTGSFNAGVGSYSLQENTVGFDNTAIGTYSLRNNIGGYGNTAIGHSSLRNNKKGHKNIGIGSGALRTNEMGLSNIAIGYNALQYLNSNDGNNNIAIGFEAIKDIKEGYNNVAIGAYTKMNSATPNEVYNNTLIGHGAEARDWPNGQKTPPSNVTAIGYGAIVYGVDEVRLGNDKVRKIGGYAGWSQASDRRWKKNIKTIPLGLDFINKVRPVEYIHKNNDKQTKEWGVIAQELQKAIAETGYQKAGIVQEDGSQDKYLSVRYTDLIAPMIKAIQELTEQTKTLNKENEVLKKKNDQTQEEIKRMASEILKIKQLENKLNNNIEKNK